MNQGRWAALRGASDDWFEQREAPSTESEYRALRADVFRRKQARRRTALGASVLTASAAAVVLALGLRDRELTFQVDGRAALAGETWGSEHVTTNVSFSDGSSLQASKASRARVLAVHETGAEVRLEQGQLRTHVVHKSSTRWAILAGDFSIQVTGTSFDTTWDPGSARVRIQMLEGRVVVFGPCLPKEGVAVVGGESREWSCAPPIALQSPKSTEEKPATPEATVAPSASAPDERRLAAAPEKFGTSPATSVSAPSEKLPPADAWRELKKERRFIEAWKAVKDSASDRNASEMLEIAELARLAGDGASASRLYRAIYDRHSGSAEASRAAFQLGRMSSGEEAYAWFERYLRAEPAGTFAQEALGRMIELAMARGDRSTASAHARTYLASYPSGPHAEYARSVLLP